MSPTAWQEQFLRAPRGHRFLALTARQVGKTTTAAWAIAHFMIFTPGSAVRGRLPGATAKCGSGARVREGPHQGGRRAESDNVYALELNNGSRVLALPGSEKFDPRPDGRWLDRGGRSGPLPDDLIAALRPMRAHRPQARFAMLSTAMEPHRSVLDGLGTGGKSWIRIKATVDVDRDALFPEFLDQERRALGEDRFKREYLGIPAGGHVSPFTWDLYDRATQPLLHSRYMERFQADHHRADVGHTNDRSTAVVGGKTIACTGLKTLLKEFEELPQGLYGSARAEALARIDRLYGSKCLIFVDLAIRPNLCRNLSSSRFGPERVIGLRSAAPAMA